LTSLLRPGMFRMCLAVARTSSTLPSRTCHTGVHSTPVDSIATWVQPWAMSQSLSATSSWVVVPKVRTSCVTDEPATTRAQATTMW
jgi:hypothetical protein